ncbi:tRNA glutamyl-Q(34) synthetase GluQRS [Paenibacillus sp. TRM 82003]|nr:tRNA glutamyl-Q(34) synthetase GluQRS [Paenibacillus sp. TRM 82003]
MIRGRFAPTPSGPMHLGNVYAALLAWLQIRSAGGAFALRIEDIDRPRSKPEWVDLIFEDLRWLGLDWDEGPDVGGMYAPYTQSERLERYEAAFRRLTEYGLVYPCYCSRAELMAVASAPHGLASEGPAYPGTCRAWNEAERREREADKAPSFRFAVPDAPILLADGLRGDVTFPPGAGGDFVVKRADGIFGYQLAVVVDDASMNVTHVLRGADLLDSTPRQLWLYEALKLQPPAFAHIPLLCDASGERLSKRHRSLAVRQLREAGLAPQALLGHIAAWCGLIDRPEPVSPAELLAGFALTKLPQRDIIIPAASLSRLEAL